MRHRAYELMRRYPDLCLNGYLVGRYSVKNTDKELKSAYLDEGIRLICEFIGYLGMKGALTQHPTNRFGSSYFWKHLVEQYSTLEGPRHHIPNGLFIATLRDLGLPEEPIFNSPNAKVPMGGKANRAIRQLMQGSHIHA
jgi:hypothetical protein